MAASRAPRDKYPFATIAAYGPDNRHATKLVVGILRRPGRSGPSQLRSWTSDAADVRHDPMIAAEVADWLLSQQIKETIRHDREIGTPRCF